MNDGRYVHRPPSTVHRSSSTVHHHPGGVQDPPPSSLLGGHVGIKISLNSHRRSTIFSTCSMSLVRGFNAPHEPHSTTCQFCDSHDLQITTGTRDHSRRQSYCGVKLRSIQRLIPRHMWIKGTRSLKDGQQVDKALEARVICE